MRLAVTAVVESLLIFKLVTFSTIGMCALVGLAALLISARKEKTFGAPIRCAVALAFVVAGLCAALALLFVYTLQKQTWEVSRSKGFTFRSEYLVHCLGAL